MADLWQNVYLKTAGATNYNALAAHNIAWTGPTVTTAFDTLAQLVGKPAYLLGGTTGSLSNTYPVCVDKVFPKPGTMPQAAMVMEGDFVVSEIVGNSSGYTAGTTAANGKKCTASPRPTPCYDFFPFPAPAADQMNNSASRAPVTSPCCSRRPSGQGANQVSGKPRGRGDLGTPRGFRVTQQDGAAQQLPRRSHRGPMRRAPAGDEFRVQPR